MHTRIMLTAVWTALICTLYVTQSAAHEESLLGVSKGRLLNDTGSDGLTRLAIVDSEQLGGKALKVEYGPGDSFGGNPPTVEDWRGYQTLQFVVFNPARKNVSLTLTIKYKQTTSYQTRADIPLLIRPGKTSIKLSLGEVTNVDGSSPDLSRVRHWYVACEPSESPTLYFGDFGLSDGASIRVGVGTGAGKIKTDPARLERIWAAKMPKIAEPVMFNTPEADAILSALEVFPPENPWNQLGDEIVLAHGAGEVSFVDHADRPFHVFGILTRHP